MIEQLTLTNFQAHRNTNLNFHNGVNVIIGSSDSGKTSIIRALNWIVNNRPSGDSFIRRGQDNVTVECVLNGGTIVSRSKTKSKNLYQINDQVYEGFGTSVPSEVTHAMCFSDINLQFQMDTPFLLSNSPGEISRYMNKLVNLDDIDKTLKNLTSMKRKADQTYTILNSEIEDLSNQIKNFSDLSKIEDVISQGESAEEKINAIESDINSLKSLISSLDLIAKNKLKYKKEIESKADVLKAITINDKVIKIANSITDLKKRLQELSILKGKVTKYEKEIRAKDLVLSAIQHVTKMNESEDKMKKLKFVVSDLNKIAEKTLSIQKEHEKLQELYESEMPEICPLCGASIK